MPKDIQQLGQEYDATTKKLMDGRKHIIDLFTVGLTFPDPRQGGNEITFNTAEDGTNYLAELNKSQDPELPLAESGRKGNEHAGMKLFLYSKGFTPEDIEELMMNPASDKSKELETKIKGFRQEYFEMLANGDLDKIGKMYADAFKNLQNVNLNWLKESDTPEKMVENLPKMEALAGSQSFYLQTNNLGTAMRTVDRECMEHIKKETEEAGIDLPKTVDVLQYIDLTHQYFNKSFDSRFRNQQSKLLNTCKLAQQNGALPENATLAELEENGLNFSRELLFMANDEPISNLDEDEFKESDWNNNMNAWIRGEEGAIPPVQVMEIQPKNIDPLSAGFKWFINQEAEDDDEVLPPRYETDPKGWRRQMTENYQQNILMDSPSVCHCVALAKEGKYDSIAGAKGEGARMLDVMKGNYNEFNKLTDLSKAAVTGRMVMEHPDLFMGTVPQMKKAAEKPGMGLDNPAYVAAMDKMTKLADPQTVQKHRELKQMMATERLESGLQNASPDQKKNLAKSLFLMQIGDAEPAGLANDKNRKAKMLDTLAAGGTVKFCLPEMTKDESSELKRQVPARPQEISAGITQNIDYGRDNTLNVRLNGPMGQASAQGGMEVDLRGITPRNLNAMLNGLDEKMSSMNDNELDALINQLKGESLDKQQAANLVQNLGLDANGVEKANRPQMDLAAKEVNPDLVLSQNELIAIERSYTRELTGERKYTARKPLDTTAFEQTLQTSDVPQHTEYFTKYLEHYKEQVRQMEMYADAAERMHRLRLENERSSEPLDNVRIFARNNEKELAEKYRAAKEKVEAMEDGIKAFSLGPSTKINDKDREKAWLNSYIDSSEVSKDVVKNYNQKGPARDQLDANLAGNFTAIDMENSTFREQQNLNNNTWTLMGVKYSNSDKYQDILDSMDKLKQMRSMDATQENMAAYEKEYEHLRDLCEDYIVSRKNPWTQDGKDRKRMVTDVWEGMSNVNAQSFAAAKNSIQPGQKIGDMNIHTGYRRQISLADLKEREHATQRNQRLESARREKAEAWRRQREQEKQNQRQAKQNAPHGRNMNS